MRSKGGAVSRCPFPSWRVMRRRARVLTADRPFTTSPRTSRHPRRLVRRRGSRSLPANPRERDAPCHDPGCLPSGDVGAPHLLTEGALSNQRKSRLTTDVDPMGFATLVRRDAALRANEPTHPRLATTHGMFHRASPCLRVFCTVPYGRWRKQRFFGPRRSQPNSATRL